MLVTALPEIASAGVPLAPDDAMSAATATSPRSVRFSTKVNLGRLRGHEVDSRVRGRLALPERELTTSQPPYLPRVVATVTALPGTIGADVPRRSGRRSERDHCDQPE